MSNIIDSIQLSGTVYTIQGTGGGGSPTVELTQAEYDALVSAGTVSANTYYIITDATPIEASGFVQTSAITSSVTSASTDSEIPTAKAVWEAASGGGTTYTAGRGIDITNDTISVSLPISAGTGAYSIAEGDSTTASGNCSHAEGSDTKANGNFSHAEGGDTKANGMLSHAEGNSTTASGYSSHAEGERTTASGYSSHAEGHYTTANGSSSHAEGNSTKANGDFSHAEGNNTTASGYYSHAEGYNTTASSVSNVSGINTYYGYQAKHAEGCSTLANNASTHAEGYYTIANNFGEHASGVFNNSASASTTWGDSGNTLFSVGNGTSSSARHNAFEIRQNGDIYFNDGTSDVKLQDKFSSLDATIGNINTILESI